MAVKTEQRVLVYLQENAIDNKYHIATKKELSEALNMSISTLSSTLNKLEERNQIVVVSKRGKNGGVVITLVKDYNTEDLKSFNDLEEENIIMSEMDYAKELRNKYFPTYKYQRREKPRRTKLEMIKYNAITDKKRKLLDDMNLYTNQLPYPTKEVFNMSDDPEGFYKAYILCKLYDQYTIAHLDANHQKHLRAMMKADNKSAYEEHSKKAEYYRNKMLSNMSRNSVTQDFFGSKMFNTFYNFYNKIKDYNFNVFKYMQNVFNNVTFYYENGSQPRPVPAPNFFSSDKYITNYQKYIKGIKKSVNNTNRHLGREDNLIDSSAYTKNPAVVLLQQLYSVGLNSELHDIDALFEHALDIEDTTFGIYSGTKHIILLQYNTIIEKELDKLPQYEREVMNKYVKQCIINEYSPMSITLSSRLSMFTMQKEYKVNTLELSQGLKKKDLLPISLANTEALSGDDIKRLEQNSNEYLYMRQHTSTYYILRMFGDYLGYEVNLREVQYIIKKYQLEDKIPLTKEGLLSYNDIIQLVEDEVMYDE